MPAIRRAICALDRRARRSANDSSTAGGICVFEQLVQRRFVLRLQRFERQLVFREEAQRRRIEERRAWRADNQRHRHAEVLVDAAQLAEIGQLVRPGDVTDRREERVLHDRPQQHVRAEVPGTARVARVDQRRCRRRCSPTTNVIAVVLRRMPSIAVEVEQRQAVVLRVTCAW